MKAGTVLAHYEITGQIGKGGMGEVYRARDTKLGREVAIKILPSEFSHDAERLARLEREARMLAALNHPNIAAIHGLEESDDTRFLVLELVDGDTLLDRLKPGPIPVEDSLKLALQIAEALEAAHAKGVIHRDLKPANIKITPEGRVKVLDFGLAKAFIGDQADVNFSNSPTLSMAATQAGVILGTAAYMSPEQASGEVADHRADVWAFGVVLYEMLTGRPLFTGKTAAHVMGAVLNVEPDWEALPRNLHPRLRVLLERLLEKEPRDRLSAVSDARVEIRKALADSGGVARGAVASVDGPARASKFTLIASVVVTAVVTLGGAWLAWPTEPHPIVRWEYLLPDEIVFRNNNRPALAISPDGSQFVYNGLGGLYLRPMDQSEARLIPGTEQPLTNPTFSPDGTWLAFYSVGDLQLKKIPVVGGASVTLASGLLNPAGISWDTEDEILYSQEGTWRVSADGGQPELVAGIEDTGVYPQLLPGGAAVLSNIGAAGTGIGGEVAVYDIGTGESKALFPGSRPRYVRTGHVVYAQATVLFAVPFDLDRLEVTGGPVPLVEGVQGGPPQYSVSDTGSLVYVPGGAAVVPDGILAFADRSGNRTALDLPPDQYRSPRVSPRGTEIAVEIIGDSGRSDIWVYDLSANAAIRRLTNGGSNTRPVWTPDGERIAFASDRDGTWGIYWQRADGSDVPERLTTAEEGLVHYPESWSPDQSTLSFAVVAGQAAWDVWTLSMEDGTSEPFVETASNDFGSAFSPDGNWLAYSTQNTEATNLGVQVQPFPPTGVVYEVQEGGETWPVWTPDGTELFSRLNLALQQTIEIRGMDISTTGAFAFGNPTTLPMQGALVFQNYRDYDVHPDGERFLMIFSPDRITPDIVPARPRVNVVLNWHQELLERVPVP